MTNGNQFERKVREYAAVRFGIPFRPEHLAGVNYDCVATLRHDYKIIVEATVNRTLEKVRGDIARLQIVKQKMLGEGIYVEAYIVLDKEPTSFMQEGAKAAKVEISSFETFYRNWYDSQSYLAARADRPFGSAMREGKNGPDSRPYVPVLFDDRDGQRYTIEKIATRIKHGSKIVLTGDFGTGKSRAIQQLFASLRPANTTDKSPVSIDLRSMWGTQSAEEVLRRHFSTLQLGSASSKAIDALHHDEFLLLLDGFDELAIQEWGSEPEAISRSRARTMEPIRDLLNSTTNGALISGRAHYFSSDQEMLDALGLPKETPILSTPPEFSLEEVKQFMHSMGFDGDIPIWLPKKPLIAEMYTDFVLSGLASAGVSRPAFWQGFMDALCQRDAKIRLSYDPDVIKQILCRLSRVTRSTKDGVGPISPSDIQHAFSAVVGQLPAQEASSMLQRLPGLGRVATENDDRQFVDDFIVEGLRGLDVCSIVSTFELSIGSASWKNGAGILGLEVIADRVNSGFTVQDAVARVQSESGPKEGPLHADIIGGLLLSDVSKLELNGVEVDGGYMAVCDFSDKTINGLSISSCEIRMLNLFNSNVVGARISNSIIEVLDGTSGEGVPGWIVNCEIGTQSQLDTIARIKKSPLKPSEMILVTVLRKTFFQPGSGRKEEALLRGLGEFGDSKLQARILSILCSRSFLSEVKGDSGRLFVPERSKTSRAKQMVSQLQQSKDEVWAEVSQL